MTSGTVIDGGASCTCADSSAELAGKRERDETEHVERGQARGHEAERKENRMVRREDARQDRVLREEPGERRDAGKGERRHEEGPIGHRQAAAEAPHPPHVLLPVKGVDDGAGPEEQARLEEGVRQDVEHPRDVRPHAAGQEHVPELGNRGVRQDLLDVVLSDRDDRREDRGDSPDDRDDVHGVGSQPEQDVAARHHVHAGRDHGGCVDER
jgi:hypothetical protein